MNLPLQLETEQQEEKVKLDFSEVLTHNVRQLAGQAVDYYAEEKVKLQKSVGTCIAGPLTDEEEKYKQAYEVIRFVQAKVSVQEIDRAVKNLKEASRFQFMTKECKDAVLKELRRLDLVKKVLEPEAVNLRS